MKLARIGLAIITSLALMLSVCLPVQASEESGEVDLSGTVPLAISDVSASSIGYYGATISWNTNGDATSQVFYDIVYHEDIADYAYHTVGDTTLISEHSIRLTGLSSGRTYHYRVRSAIPDTEFIAISEDFSFRTSSPAPPPPPTYYTATNLFGVEKSYRISRTGEILKTIEATSEDGMLTMTIPEGTIALDKEGERLETLEAGVDESPPDPPEDAHIIGLAYDFGPKGATFDPSITLTWSYDPDLPESVAEEDLVVAYLVVAYYDEDAGEWVELDSVVDPENNTITASVSHFTTFAIISTVTPPAPPAPAAFSVRNLSVLPAEVEPSETVAITVLVANTGGELGSYTVVLKIDGVKEDEERVTVAAGSSKTVTFSVTKEEADTYAVTVAGLSGSFTVVPVVAPPAPAAFSVSRLSIQPAEVEATTAATIAVLVSNTGGTEGSYTLVLKIDGVKEAEERVTIAAGESQDVTFSVTREDPGDYTVDVDGLTGGFTVLLLVEPPGVNWALIGGIIAAAVIVAGLLIYFLLIRRRAH